MSRPVQTAFTADVRIGVTPVEHELLDQVERDRQLLSGFDVDSLLAGAAGLAVAIDKAISISPLDFGGRDFAIRAASRLIIAVEQMDAGK